MSNENLQNQNQQSSTQSKPRKLKEIVDIDRDYIERKDRYEQQLAQGDPNATPPKFSDYYLNQREERWRRAIQENQQPPRSTNATSEPSYSIPVNNLIESAPLQVPDKQTSTPQIVDNHNITLPVPNIPQFNLKNAVQQNLEMIGVVPATQIHGLFMIGDFMVSKDGYYCTNKDGQLVRFTDFFITVEYRENLIAVDGSSSQNYSICLTNDFGHQVQLSVPAESWTNLQNQIERQAPEFQVFTDEQRNAREKFKRLLSEILKHTQIPTKIVYDYWGWGQPLNNGTRRFFHGGLSDCNSEKFLPPPRELQDHRNTLVQALNIINVGNHEVTVPIIFYCLASYADALFTDAGYPLAHCLMIVGESGSMKTSFAKVVFAPFNPENDRVYTVRSTEASLRVLHEKYYDDTLVVDDFNREGSLQEVKEKMRNIQALIRAYSDKTPRAKYGGRDNVKKYALRGGCVFTGETKLVGQLKSSELRYIKVIFKKRLNGDNLAFFQKNPGIWSYFVATFIRHLEQHYADIVEYTKRTFEAERKITGLENARLIDAFLQLKIIAQIFCNVFWEAGIFSQEQFNNNLNDFVQILHQVVSHQEQEATTQDHCFMYLDELFNLIGTGLFPIAPDIKAYMQNIRYYMGYKDAENQTLMVKKDVTFHSVQNAFAARHDYLPVSADDLSKILKAKGLTKCDAGSCLKKAPSMIAGRPRMLALIEHKCLDFIQKQKQHQ